MYRYLSGSEARQNRNWKGVELASEGVELRERESMPSLSILERKRTFREVNLGFSEEQPIREADRCLRICVIQGIEAKIGRSMRNQKKSCQIPDRICNG